MPMFLQKVLLVCPDVCSHRKCPESSQTLLIAHVLYAHSFCGHALLCPTAKLVNFGFLSHLDLAHSCNHVLLIACSACLTSEEFCMLNRIYMYAYYIYVLLLKSAPCITVHVLCHRGAYLIACQSDAFWLSLTSIQYVECCLLRPLPVKNRS